MSSKGVVTGNDFALDSDDGSGSEYQMRLLDLQVLLAEQIPLYHRLVSQRKAISDLFYPSNSESNQKIPSASHSKSKHRKK